MIRNVIEKLKSYQFKYLNIRILVYVTILCTIGVLSINSASDSSYAIKQVIGIILGTVIMAVLALVDYHFTLKFYWLFYIVNIILLVIVKFAGKTALGAQRWIKIGGFQLQPSELSKVLLILFFARFLSDYKDQISNWKFLLVTLGLLAVPALLIISQPDLSTTIVIVLLFCAIIFLSGISYKIVGIVFAITIPIAVLLVFLIMQPNPKVKFLQSYQYKRIHAFFDREDKSGEQYRYQQENSILAIGSGGLYGKGLNNNSITSVKNGNYLDEAHTDFIFTIVGEELGFVGTFSVIILLILIIVDCFITGSRAPDMAGRLICQGLGCLIGIQALINMGVVTMLLPNTGLTLPFVSSGVSSIISLFTCLGILLNVSIQRKNKLHSEEEI